VSDAAPVIVISSGEPAGIGPDICCQLATAPRQARLAVIGDPALLTRRAADLGIELRVLARAAPEDVTPQQAGSLQVLPIALAVPAQAGRLDPANAGYVLEMLRLGTDLCLSGRAAALVTAPVHKSVITESGVPFTGHTEFLAARCGTPQVVMLLASPELRVALVTTHLPLREVADAVTPDRLEATLRIVDADLHARFGIRAPRQLVLGLNPHAGESGTLGQEEQRTIEPVLAALRAEGLKLIGPVSADTAFTAESLARADVVVAMYHDQGLPVLKAAGFGNIVNVTLGLPILRTSVDHGTALDLAGTGRARADSLGAAVDLALRLSGSGRG
jgi:4-hydroxythreonine-4-phosphate dehydrogenase